MSCPHEEETLIPFKEGTGQGQGSFRIDVVTDHGALFSEKIKYNSFSLMLDVAVANPLGPTALACVWTRAGYPIEEAVKAKNTQYGGKYRPTNKLDILAFSTCGDFSSSAQDLSSSWVKPRQKWWQTSWRRRTSPSSESELGKLADCATDCPSYSKKRWHTGHVHTFTARK